ncbi:hypothetical protein M0R45_019173 [Rubus argutus]|uniref:Uncharacterized protein n=1 Tax=Rubus argutus TaxID=59490 RepID=A0AAW1X767_RUBAR
MGGSVVRAEERNPRWVSCEPDGVDERRWWLGWDGEDAMAAAAGWAHHGFNGKMMIGIGKGTARLGLVVGQRTRLGFV